MPCASLYSSGQLTITGWKSNSVLREDSASLHDVIDALTDVAVAIVRFSQYGCINSNSIYYNVFEGKIKFIFSYELAPGTL